jgi:hypothetical protein
LADLAAREIEKAAKKVCRGIRDGAGFLEDGKEGASRITQVVPAGHTILEITVAVREVP